MSFIAAAIIGAVGVGAGALIANHGAHEATQAATTANDRNLAVAERVRGENVGYLSPWMRRGNAAGDRINGLLGLGGDPAAASGAWDAYRGSTGYQFGLDEGQRAQDHAAAAGGMRASGPAYKAAQRYGVNYASTKFQDYINNLSGVSGQGLAGANALADVGTNLAGQVTNANNAQADATGNAALLGSSNINSLIGQFGTLGANFLGQRQGFTGSSYSGGSGGITTRYNPGDLLGG